VIEYLEDRDFIRRVYDDDHAERVYAITSKGIVYMNRVGDMLSLMGVGVGTN
jgi:predicted transcriptional regulator